MKKLIYSILFICLFTIILAGVGSAGTITNTLNSPASGSTQLTNLVTFNATSVVTGGATLVNITLFTNESGGTWGARNTSSYSGNNLTENLTTDASWDSSSQTLKSGWNITIINTFRLTKVFKPSISGATRAYIYYSNNNTQIANATFTGNVATFNNVLSAGQTYSIVADKDGTSYTWPNKPYAGGYPIAKTNFNVVKPNFNLQDYNDNYIPGLLGLEEAFDIASSTQTFTNTYASGSNILWNVQACDSDGACGFAPSNYTFSVDSVAPTITVNYPTTLVNYGRNGGNLTLNYTATDSNLDKCWYNYNFTNSSAVSCTTAVANLANITLTSQKNVTFYANDTAGNLGSSVKTWDYKIFQNNQTYSTDIYETSATNFLLNLTYSPSTYSLTVKLSYDGTNYTATETSTGIFEPSTFEIPALVGGSTTKQFYWLIDYIKFTNSSDSGIIQTDTTNQSVGTISLYSCTSATNRTLNFTAYDEENTTSIKPYNFLGTFDFWVGSGSVYKTISISNLSVNYSALCLAPSTGLTYYTNAIIQYEKDGYIKRNYYLRNASITNTTLNISLFLLENSASTSFIISVKDSSQKAVKDAYLYIQRYYPGTNTFNTVAMTITDNSGQSVAHFEAETEDYKILVYKDGEMLYESPVQKIYCTASPCTIPIQIAGSGIPSWTPIGNLSNFIYSLTFNNATSTWSYSYVSTSGTFSYARLYVYQSNPTTGKTTICNTTSVSNAATLTCNVSAYDGQVYAEDYVSRSPEVLVWAESIIQSIAKTIFGLEGLFWAFFIMMVLAIAGALVAGPVGAMAFTVACFVFLPMIGIASFGAVALWGTIILGVLIAWIVKS